jgi:hypothetical protein
MFGLILSRLTYSVCASVNTSSTIVLISGPAGYQHSEEAPEEPVVMQGPVWVIAFASGTAGRWKFEEREPPRAKREKAIEKTMTSLTSDFTLNSFEEKF